MGVIKRNYHWVIVAVVLLELAVYCGIINNISSLYIIPVTTELSISRGSFSLAYSIRSLAGFFSTLFSGIFFLRFGYRKLAAIALMTVTGAFVLLSNSSTVWMLAAASALLGLGEGFCSTAAASRMVNTWFHTHQGLVLGLVSAATGLGGSLFSIVLSGVIGTCGWRISYLLCALICASMAVLIFLLSRDHPGKLGLQPFGAGQHHGKTARKENHNHWYGYEPKDVTRKPTFYLMIAVVFLSCVCSYTAFSVVAPHFQDRGMRSSQAATLQSIMLLSLAASKFICGLLGDIIGAKALNLLCMASTILSLILMAIADSYTAALVSVLVFSIALVMTTITIPLLSSAIFGYHSQNSIIGILMALVPAANVVAVPIVNVAYDRIGSYSPIFLAAAGIGLVTLALMFLLFALSARDRNRYESAHSELSAIAQAE